MSWDECDAGKFSLIGNEDLLVHSIKVRLVNAANEVGDKIVLVLVVQAEPDGLVEVVCDD